MKRLRGEIDYEDESRREAVDNTDILRRSGYPSAVTSETYSTQLRARRRFHGLPANLPTIPHNS